MSKENMVKPFMLRDGAWWLLVLLRGFNIHFLYRTDWIFPIAATYQVTLSNSSALETIESSQASILYQATLSRIDGTQVQQLPTVVSVTLVAEGTPSNTVSGNNQMFPSEILYDE